ncbi:MAG: FGGY-family carbohydrate kinase [Actinomycetaceae bacterium]|nr:FGGY-family carbohydrate kinase [Actinomycetaceae bacterium]MDY6082424.1 FGGY-family carbohydrate kinase [Actinomycetaceae bacterium]
MFVLTYDVGTSSVTTRLYEAQEGEGRLTLCGSARSTFPIAVLPHSRVEQDPDEWWHAVVDSTHRLTDAHPEIIAKVQAISISAQMRNVVLVDEDGRHLRPAISYMDQRAVEQRARSLEHGAKVAGVNATRLAESLYRTAAMSSSAWDPMWKYLWVKDNEPDVYDRIYKWLDTKEYLICRMTSQFVTSVDSASAALLLDVRSKEPAWADRLATSFAVNPAHLPTIAQSTAAVGTLQPQVAAELGLPPAVTVYSGCGDATAMSVGSGVYDDASTSIYWGHHGWVSTITTKRAIDLNSMIATIDGAQEDKFTYFADLEAAGKALEWVKTRVVAPLDGDLSSILSSTEPGAGGVIFAPWLTGNRHPFRDANARGMFFNVSMDTGLNELVRSVIEGVSYHFRWLLDAQDKKVTTSSTVRLVGSAALSPQISQILADVLGRTIQTVEEPEHAASVGAAIVALVGAGVESNIASAAKKYVKVRDVYTPNPANRDVYDAHYEVFRTLYENNKKAFMTLNSPYTLAEHHHGLSFHHPDHSGSEHSVAHHLHHHHPNHPIHEQPIPLHVMMAARRGQEAEKVAQLAAHRASQRAELHTAEHHSLADNATITALRHTGKNTWTRGKNLIKKASALRVGRHHHSAQTQDSDDSSVAGSSAAEHASDKS